VLSVRPAHRHSDTAGAAAAVGVALIVFAGFARSYYLRSLFNQPPLTGLVHLHGAVMTSWFLLFIAQARLVAAHRVDWHRRLGILCVVTAASVVVTGVAVMVATTAREVQAHPDSGVAAKYLSLLGFNLCILLTFALLFVGALVARRRPDVHKRLMLLASLTLLLPAVARLIHPLVNSHVVASLVFDTCVLACVALDTARHRRLHPVFVRGAPFVIVSQHLFQAAALTLTWQTLAARLVA
jgi:hypothetical protein